MTTERHPFPLVINTKWRNFSVFKQDVLFKVTIFPCVEICGFSLPVMGCCRWLQPFKLILSQTKVQQKRTNKTKTTTRKRIAITTSRPHSSWTLWTPELYSVFCVWFRRCMLRYQKKRWQLWLPQCFWLVWVFSCGSIWTKSKRWSGGKGTEIITLPWKMPRTRKHLDCMIQTSPTWDDSRSVSDRFLRSCLTFFPFLKFLYCSERRFQDL